MPNSDEAGWLAGLLDSKGRILITRSKDDGYQLLVMLRGPTATLKKCQSLFGGKRGRTCWKVEGREAKLLLCRVQAALVEKREHAAAALLFPAGSSPRARAVQEVCYRTLRILNRCGLTTACES